MSDIGPAKWSRRQLLKSGLALAAGFVTAGPRRVLADEEAQTPPTALELPGPFDAQRPHDPQYARWAFLSDTHIAADPTNHYRGFYPYRNLEEVTAQIVDDLPDGLVIAGDLARLRGQTPAYNNLKTLLAPVARQRPVYLGLGNHDNRTDFYQAFENGDACGTAVEDKHIVTADAGPVRLIILDTLLRVNRMTGKLGSSQRAWLESFLQTCDDKPTIVFLHHTLNFELLDTRPLLELLRPVAKVKAVVYGHSHKYRFSEVAGIHLINLPATGFNLSGNQPVGWVEARLTATGGEFTLHAIDGNRNDDGHTQMLAWRS